MKNSIVVGPMARKLADAFMPNGRVYSEALQCGKFDLWVHARACTIKGKPSGGIHLWASASPAPYCMPVNVMESVAKSRFVRQKRIRKPRDLKAAIYRHAADLAERVRQDRASPLWALRDQVNREANQREYDIDSVPTDRTQDYVQMSADDCAFWLEWLQQQPIKKETA